MEHRKWADLTAEERTKVINMVNKLRAMPIKNAPRKEELAGEQKYKHLWQRKVTYTAEYNAKTSLFDVYVLLGNGDTYEHASHKELGAALMIAMDRFGQRAIKESHPSYGSDGSGRNLMPYLHPIKHPDNVGTKIYGDCWVPKDVQVAIRENAVLSGHEKVVPLEDFSRLTGIPQSVVKNLTISGNLEVLTIPRAGAFVPVEIVNGFRKYWFDRERPVAADLSEEYLCAVHQEIVKDGFERESSTA